MIQKKGRGQLMKIFGVIVVLLILIAGIYLLVSPSMNLWPRNIRIIFALIIITYGFFRLFTIVHLSKKRRHNL